jgi:hypothetical protein
MFLRDVKFPNRKTLQYGEFESMMCRYMQLLLKKLTRKKLSKVLLKVLQGKFLYCGENDERRLKESSEVCRHVRWFYLLNGLENMKLVQVNVWKFQENSRLFSLVGEVLKGNKRNH